jgi:hypothetical protein
LLQSPTQLLSSTQTWPHIMSPCAFLHVFVRLSQNVHDAPVQSNHIIGSHDDPHVCGGPGGTGGALGEHTLLLQDGQLAGQRCVPVSQKNPHDCATATAMSRPQNTAAREKDMSWFAETHMVQRTVPDSAAPPPRYSMRRNDSGVVQR